MANIPLYLFAKAPQLGKVKTRLEPYIGASACVELATMMLQQSATKVATFWPGELVLCVTPSVDHKVFKELVSTLNCRVLKQIQGDLGAKMFHALDDGIALASKAVVMGCDVPHIDKSTLEMAWQIIQRGENVVGPAEDGGFYLLGTSGIPEEVFANVSWGEVGVLDQVNAQSSQVGISFRQTATLRDIDRPEDILWLANREPCYKKFAAMLSSNHQYSN